MKKMRNMFEKHDLLKIVLLGILVTLVLTWIIPYGYFSGSTFTSSGLGRVGLSDILLSGIFSTNFFMQQLLFVISVGIFYAILTKVSGYKALVSKIATLFKGKEKVFVVVASLCVTLLTTFLAQTYVVVLFIPFIINIAHGLKFDKITAFMCSFGSMLVGVLGATYGTEGFVYFVNYLNNYQNVSLTNEIGVRFGILAFTFGLYNFFMIRHMNKTMHDKKKEELEDMFSLEDKDVRKVKVWPMALFFLLLLVFAILGYVNWSENFDITIFNDFHTWLTELKIGDYTVISYILGANAKAFGAWDLYCITVVMAILLLLSIVIYRVKMDDVLESVMEGIKKIIKPVLLLLLIYVIFVFIYWSPFTITISNWILGLSEGFNPFLTTISAAISSLFHIDFGYTGFALGSVMVSQFGTSFDVGFVIYVAINGLVSFVAPTSAILFLGLSYLDIPYKKWLKSIWKFALIMLAVLLLIFVLLTFI